MLTCLQYVSYYVFSAVFVALQHSFTHICVGNEHSANIINCVHPRYGTVRYGTVWYGMVWYGIL